MLTGVTANVTNPNNYDWVVTTDKDYSDEAVFLLAVYEPGTGNSFESQNFNITISAATNPQIDTSAPPSATSTTFASVVTSVQVQPSVAAISSAASSTTSGGSNGHQYPGSGGLHHGGNGSDSNGSLGMTTKVGLGVGVGLGVPLSIAIGILAGWMLRACYKQRKVERLAAAESCERECQRKATRNTRKYYKMPISPPIPMRLNELPGPRVVYELPPHNSPRSTIGANIIPGTRPIPSIPDRKLTASYPTPTFWSRYSNNTRR